MGVTSVNSAGNSQVISEPKNSDLAAVPSKSSGLLQHPLRSIIWSAARWDVVFGLLISPLHAACEVALGFVSGALLQLIFSAPGESNLQRMIPKSMADVLPDIARFSRAELMTLVPALLVLAGFCRMLTSFGSNYLLERAGHRVAHALRSTFLDSYLRTSGRILDTRNPDEITNRILLDTSLMQALVSKGTIGALRDGLVVIGTALAMLYVASNFFLFLVAIFVLFFFVLRTVARRLEFFTRESARRQVEMATRGMQMRSGLQAIYGMGAQAREQHDLQSLSEGYYKFVRKTFLLRAGFRPAMEVLAIAVLAAALQWRLSFSSEVDVASYSTVFVLAALSFRPLKNVSGFVSQMAELKAVWKRLADEWDLVHSSIQLVDRAGENRNLRAGTAILLQKVSYDALDGRKIIEACSIEFKEGSRVALVGESGAGKSTLLRLLAGLLPPSEGYITGISKTVLATQTPYVFQGVILENIIYPSRNLNKIELQRARDRAVNLVLTLMLAHTEAGAELFLNKKVGFMGEGLSGGERARVALARLLFADRSILLLDEPSANLDAGSAAAFWAAVWRWQNQPGCARTVIAVTHDYNDLSHFDVAHVFSKGRLVFTGAHDVVTRFCEELNEANFSSRQLGTLRS